MKNEAVKAREAVHKKDVAARWRELESGKLARVIEIVNEASMPVKATHQAKVNALLRHPTMRIGAKIEAMWTMIDELGAIAAPHAACRKGCSHCCYTSVLIPAQEAALIGERIGVKPAKVTGITRRGDIKAGYHNPCPFLNEENGECSIYDSRPLACRQQYNMDGTDALLCELIGPSSKVPYLNLMDYQGAFVMLTATQHESIERNPRTGRREPCIVTTAPDVGDIREFFPKGKR